MIELPEALSLAKALNENLNGKTVSKVMPPSSEHKFCWYHEDVNKYGALLEGRIVTGTEGFGIFVEILFDNDVKLNFNDGVGIRLLPPKTAIPAKYQLLIEFTDGYSLVFTVAMYGGIICYRGKYSNEYYNRSKQGISPLSEAFHQNYFFELLDSMKPTKSLKAFLATEQRIIGLGNGVLQDILFSAKLHPKRKVKTLTTAEKERLFHCIKDVLTDMTKKGGRDTEKGIFGNAGGYATLLSKKTIASGCPCCKGKIIKEAYLGGSIYYCPVCQPLEN